MIFDNFTIIEDKSSFYFTEDEITDFKKNDKCKIEHKEYTYKEIKDLCDPVKNAVEDIVKNLDLPTNFDSYSLHTNLSTYYVGKESIILKLYLLFR